jgi:hypothetical protein
MKKFINLVALLLFSHMLCAQTDVELNTKIGNAWKPYTAKAVCPQLDVTFQIIGYESGCHTVTFVNTFGTPTPSSVGEFTLQIQDTGDSTFIDVKKNGGSCSPTAKDAKKFFIPVLSLKKTKPKISLKSGSLDVGFIQEPVEFVARTQWPFLGTEDDPTQNPLKFTRYEWSWVLPGWTNIGGAQDSNIFFRTDIGSGGLLRTRAINLACDFGGPSKYDTVIIKRTIESPCPIKAVSLDYELCGQTSVYRFNSDTFPANYTESSPTWVWSVSPSSGISTEQSLDNTYRYTSDGSKARRVSVTITDYGVSNTCFFDIPLRLINPLTTLNGPSLVCNTESFSLSLPPGPGVMTTWRVTSPDGSLSSIVSPSYGTGSIASISPTGSGEATIEFKLVGCDSTRNFSKSFFVGKPTIKPNKIDGNRLTYGMNYVCPDNLEGSHYLSVKLEGDTDGCVDQWKIAGTTSYFPSCKTIDFSLQANSQGWFSCVFIQAFASNKCGTTEAIYAVCPSEWACEQNPWYFKFSPNPVDDQTIITLNLKVSDNDSKVMKMDRFEIFDQRGNLIQEVQPELDEYWLNTVNYPKGTYYIRTSIEGSPLMEPFMVEHGE